MIIKYIPIIYYNINIDCILGWYMYGILNIVLYYEEIINGKM